MKKTILLALISVVSCGSVFAADQTVTFTLEPAMHCAKCEAKVKNRLKFERGIKSLDISSKTNTVVVKYDDKKNSVEKLESELAKIGFKASVVSSDVTNNTNAKKSK